MKSATFGYETYLSPFTWRYGSEEMRQLWSQAHKRRLWRRVWVALATAQQIAAYLRHLSQSDPTLRLPDLAEELERIARGRRRFVGLTGDDLGFAGRGQIPHRALVA